MREKPVRRGKDLIATSRILFLAAISLVAGCDYVHGVTRFTNVAQVPPFKCVEDSLRKVDGVSDVVYRIETGGRPLTAHGVEKPDQVHRYMYTYAGLNGNFVFIVNYKGDTEFYHTYIDINATPPQADIDAIRPAMSKIEKRVANECEVVDLASSIKESCSGVQCK